MAGTAHDENGLHWPETEHMVRVREAEIDGVPGLVVFDDAGEIVFHSTNRSAVWFWVTNNDLKAVMAH